MMSQKEFSHIWSPSEFHIKGHSAPSQNRPFSPFTVKYLVHLDDQRIGQHRLPNHAHSR